MANLWRCVPCGRDTQHHCSFPGCVEGVCNICFTADDSDDARFCEAHLSPLAVSICRRRHRRALSWGISSHLFLAPRLAGAPPPFSAGLTNAYLPLFTQIAPPLTDEAVLLPSLAGPPARPRPHTCTWENCDKSFTTKWTLRQHIHKAIEHYFSLK